MRTMSGGHAGTGSGPAGRGPLERADSPFDRAVRKYYYAAMTTAATPTVTLRTAHPGPLGGAVWAGPVL